MIYTLTLNPSLDLTIQAEKLRCSTILPAVATQRDPAGKGINISRALQSMGEPSIVLGLSAGVNGMVIEQMLRRDRLSVDMLPVAGEGRANLSLVVGKPPRHYKLNEAGPKISRSAQDALLTLLKGRLERDDYLVISGSLPPGVAASYLKRLIRLAKKLLVHVVLDADAEALRQGIIAGPQLIKPNREEILRLMAWRTLDGPRLARALPGLLTNGLKQIIVSLGAGGALWCDGKHTFIATPPRAKVISEVGCGDALLAGVVSGLKLGWTSERTLAWGVAAGTAKVSRPGTQMPTKREIEAVCRKVKLKVISG
jgi:1-phosphofructokinase